MIRTASATMAAATGSRGVLLLMFCSPDDTAYTCHNPILTIYKLLNTESPVVMLNRWDNTAAL